MSGYPGVKVGAVATSAIVVIQTAQNVFWQAPPAYSLGLVCTLSAGASLTYTVQVTADQIPSATGNWNNHDVLVNQTLSANSNIIYPVTGVRLNVTSWASGTVNLGIAQWP